MDVFTGGFEVVEILIQVVILLAAILITQDWWKHRHFPKGPRGLPIIGYLPYIGNKPFETFSKLRRQYGGVLGLKVGFKRIVVLNDWNAVREFLVEKGDTFSGRPSVFSWDYHIKQQDITTASGPVWKEQRKFMMKNMKDFGFGVRSSEDLILNSVHMVMDELRIESNKNRPIPFEPMFFIPIMNIVWSHCAGRGMYKKDEESRKLGDLVRKLEDGFSVTNHPVNFMPVLRYLVPGGFGFWKFQEMVQEFIDKMVEEVRVHEASFVAGKRRDFIDVYLEEIHDRIASGSQPKPPYSHEHLVGTILDIFLGGTDTTNNTLQWGFLLAALHPHVQRKIQEELDAVIGRDRLPSIQDSPKLKYLEAFTLEVNRFVSLVPLSIPHTNLRDATVRGFRIPAGTTIFQNIHGIHHDPEVWGDPSNFRPERFLNDENCIVKPPAFMAFSMGNRSCPGEPMAKMELFLFYGCLMHTFTFGVPNGKCPSLEPNLGLTLTPKPYSLTCTVRDS